MPGSARTVKRRRVPVGVAVWGLLLVANAGLGAVRLRERIAAAPRTPWGVATATAAVLAPYGGEGTAAALATALAELPGDVPIVVVADEAEIGGGFVQLVFATSLVALPRPVGGVLCSRGGGTVPTVPLAEGAPPAAVLRFGVAPPAETSPETLSVTPVLRLEPRADAVAPWTSLCSLPLPPSS